MKKFFTLLTMVVLSVGAYAQYCVPTYTTGPTVGDSIVSFQLETINASFPGAASGYNDYTTLASTNLTAGGSYTATVVGNPGFGITAAIWIDFNQDTVFDAIEKVGEVGILAGQTGTISFTVPPGAVIDTTRLRLVGVFAGSGLTPCGAYTFGETEDYEVILLPPPPNDVGVTAIDTFAAGCGLTATEVITVELTNFGTNAQTTFPMFYSVNGGTAISETYTGTLAGSGGLDTFSFATTADLSLPSTTYSIQVWSSLTGDGGPGNDTLTYVIQTSPGAPYFEDFETFVAGNPGTGFQNGWTFSSTSASTFVGWSAENSGTANSTGTGPLNNNTPGGSVYMFTETSGGTAGDIFNLFSPCISLAGTTTPRLSFFYHMFGPLMGTLNVIVVGGSSTGTDTTIFTISGEQQTAETDPWTEVIVDLTPWAGTSVELNFQSIHGGVFTSDMSLDDINIYQPAGTDVSPIAIIPSGESCFTSAEPITVQVRNLGSSPLDFSLNPLTVTVDISVSSTQTFTSAVVNSGTLGVLDTLDVQVTTTADLSAVGPHLFTAYTNLTGDGDALNDTTIGGVSSLPILSIPYFEDFETGVAGSPGTLPTGWTREGSASNFNGWLVETDGIQNTFNTGPIDDHTPGGSVYVYTENAATGTYSLVSPCLDITGFSAPKLGFWYHMFGADIGTLEAQVRTAAGSTTIFSVSGQQQTAEGDDWLEGTADLTPWIGQSVQIVFVGTSAGFNGDIGIDDVNIFQPPPVDVKGLAVTAPLPGCGLGSMEAITFDYQNFGTVALSNVIASYSINGGPFITPEAITGTVNPGDTATYTFTTLADFSAGGIFDIQVVVTQTTPLDTVNTNDTINYSIQNFPAYTGTYPYYEDFESGQGGWSATATPTSSWGFGTPAKATIQGAASGINAWATALDSTFINVQNAPATYNPNESSSVISPCFDFTALDTPVVRMSVWWNSEFSWDGAVLQSSVDGGTNWVNVGQFGDPDNWYNDNTINGAPGGSQEGWTGRNSTSNGSGGWVTASHRLDSLGGETQVVLRVAFGSDGSVQDDGFAFDNVAITEFSPINGQIGSLLNPVTGCGLPDTSTVEISYSNVGTAPITSYTVSYTVVGSGVVVTETPGDTIQPGAVLTYAFNGKADLSVPATYNIQYWITATGDTDTVNDTTTSSVTHKTALSTFPYFQNFDGPLWVQTPQTFPIGIGTVNLPEDWENIQGEGSQDWAVWTGASGFNTGPTSDHTTGSDQYLFVDDSFAGNNDSVIVVSPCFDVTALNSPKLSFWYHSNNSNTPNDENELHIDLIFNGSIIFDVIAPIEHKDNNWNLAEIDLTQYLGNIAVRFRVNNNNNFGNHDIAIDDFGIVDVLPQDAGVTSIASPVSGCGLPAVDTLLMALSNLGTDTIFGGLNVSYTINGGAVTTVAITDTILPGFLVPVSIPGINFSTPGDYTVVAWSSGLTGDTNAFNDSATSLIKSIPTVSTFPYVQDFESGDGGWSEEFPTGGKPLWGFGTPAKPIIQGAASGVNAWATALDSTYTSNDNIPARYGDNEDSWVISPCMDFSALSAPTIQMSIWWDSEFSWDGAVLQSTVDNGATWVNVGQFGDPDNWYNDNTLNSNPGGSSEAWTGTFGNSSGGWVVAKNRMDSLAGEPEVRLRVAFGSDGSGIADGFAFDDIFIFDTPGDDVGVTAITDPSSFGCSDDSVVVAVNLVNFGLDTASNVPVVVDVTGAGTVTLNGTFPGPLAPGDTANFVVGFLNTNAGGLFNLSAYTVYAGDTLVFNDTTFSSTDVTVRPPAPTAVNDSVILCVADSTMLMVLNDTSYSYVWYDSAFAGNVLASDTNVFQTGFLTSDTSFWVEAIPGGGGPPMKVTEVELGGPDYLEIQNTGNSPVDVTGWTVAIGEDGAASINTVATTSWALTGIVNPGDILWRDDATASGVNYWGSNILWNPSAEGWVVILDQNNNVVDALFFNYTDAQILNFSPTINGTVIDASSQWTGAGAVSTGFSNLRRVGSTDNNDASDWTGATANVGLKGLLNPGLSLPVSGGGSGGGCPSDRIEIKVIVAPLVPVDLGPDGIECSGFVIDAFDPGFASYTWSTGASTSSITADTSGLYYVDVVNSLGCVGSDSIFLTINPSPSVDLGPQDTTVCGMITLDAGNAGATFVWSEPGQFGQTIDVTQSGQYFVTVNSLGCEGTDTINVTVNPNPVVDLGSDQTSCVDVPLDAGNPGSTYAWSTGATSQTITVTPPATGSDTISVVVTNASLCDVFDEIIISAGVPPVVDLGPDVTNCDSVVLDAGVAGATYTWSSGQTTQTIAVTMTGTYSVEVIDGSGCDASDTVDVTVEQKPVADFTFNNAQFGFTYDFTNVSTGGVSYAWDFGDTGTSTDENPTHTYQFPGAYEVTLIVTNACGNDTLKTLVSGVDIDNETFGRMIELYPNPTKGEFFVSADDFTAEELTIKVTDTRGRIVYNEVNENVFGGFRIRVDLGAEAEGVYLVEISDGENTTYKRVIRE